MFCICIQQALSSSLPVDANDTNGIFKNEQQKISNAKKLQKCGLK